MAFTTAEKVQGLIESIQYHVFPGTTLTICCITLKNGYSVIGKSACAIPADFNKELGEEYSYEDALKVLWELEAYAYKNKVYGV